MTKGSDSWSCASPGLRALFLFGGLPFAIAAVTVSAAAALVARRVLRSQVGLHPGGGVPFKDPSKDVHTGPSRVCLAPDFLLSVLNGGGGGLSCSPFGLLASAGSHLFREPLQMGLLRFQGLDPCYSLGPLPGELPWRGLNGLLLCGVRLSLGQNLLVGVFLRLLYCPLLG